MMNEWGIKHPHSLKAFFLYPKFFQRKTQNDLKKWRRIELRNDLLFLFGQKKHTMDEDVFDQILEALHQSDTPEMPPQTNTRW